MVVTQIHVAIPAWALPSSSTDGQRSTFILINDVWASLSLSLSLSLFLSLSTVNDGEFLSDEVCVHSHSSLLLLLQSFPDLTD